MKLILKIYLILFIANLLFIPKTASATDYPKQVLIINQVRGVECCQPGSVDFLKRQIQLATQLELPTSFSVRYDALNNPEMSQALKEGNPNFITLSGFLEITPKLALDSNVEYLGELEYWYEAHQAYTIGYNSDDRIKIVDQYMNSFQKVFGRTPETITSWMIDTPTAKYLENKYGVKIFQITREQWGTDSYTLSGGPIHYPYLASDAWLFQPAQNSNRRLMVIRQTGSDPLLNYGDTTNAFTTQPNDYSIDGKSINYFTFLADELLNQPYNKYGFLVLGLENSMEERYQSEFTKQMSWLNDYRNNKGSVSVVFPTNFYDNYFSQGWAEDKVTLVNGVDWTKNTSNQAIWANAPEYRLRLLIKNDRPIVTDWRVYCSDCEDPYTYHVAQNRGFWVTPFLIDGSRLYKESYQHLNNFQKLKLKIQKIFLPELQIENKEPSSTTSDLQSFPQGLILPKIDGGLSINDDIVEYQNDQIGQVSIIFEDNEVIFSAKNIQKLLIDNMSALSDFNSSIKYQINETGNEATAYWDGQDFYLNLSCKSSFECSISTEVGKNLSIPRLIKEEHISYFPEISEQPISKDRTVAYTHNKFSIVGESPSRIVIIPRDQFGYSAKLANEVIIKSDLKIKDYSIQYQDGNSGIIYVDVLSESYGKQYITIELTDHIATHSKVVEAVFAPDCVKKIGYCIMHPQHASWYIKSKFYQFLRK